MPASDNPNEASAIEAMANELDSAAADVEVRALSPEGNITSRSLVNRTHDDWGRPVAPMSQHQQIDRMLSGMGIGPGNISGEAGHGLIGNTVTNADVGPGLETFGPSRFSEGRFDDARRSSFGPDTLGLDQTGIDPAIVAQIQRDASNTDTARPGPRTSFGPDTWDVTGQQNESPVNAGQAGADVRAFLGGLRNNMGGGPQDIRGVTQPGAQFAEGVPQGPYDAEGYQGFYDPEKFNVDPTVPGSLRNRNIQSQMGGGPSDVHEAPMGSYDYRAGRVNEPVPKTGMERLMQDITSMGGNEMGNTGPDSTGVPRHDMGYGVDQDIAAAAGRKSFAEARKLTEPSSSDSVTSSAENIPVPDSIKDTLQVTRAPPLEVVTQTETAPSDAAGIADTSAIRRAAEMSGVSMGAAYPSTPVSQGLAPVEEEVVMPELDLGYPRHASGNIPANIRTVGTGEGPDNQGMINGLLQLYPQLTGLPFILLQRAIADGEFLRELLDAAERDELWLYMGNPNAN